MILPKLIKKKTMVMQNKNVELQRNIAEQVKLTLVKEGIDDSLGN